MPGLTLDLRCKLPAVSGAADSVLPDKDATRDPPFSPTCNAFALAKASGSASNSAAEGRVLYSMSCCCARHCISP